MGLRLLRGMQGEEPDLAPAQLNLKGIARLEFQQGVAPLRGMPRPCLRSYPS